MSSFMATDLKQTISIFSNSAEYAQFDKRSGFHGNVVFGCPMGLYFIGYNQDAKIGWTKRHSPKIRDLYKPLCCRKMGSWDLFKKIFTLCIHRKPKVLLNIYEGSFRPYLQRDILPKKNFHTIMEAMQDALGPFIWIGYVPSSKKKHDVTVVTPSDYHMFFLNWMEGEIVIWICNPDQLIQCKKKLKKAASYLLHWMFSVLNPRQRIGESWSEQLMLFVWYWIITKILRILRICRIWSTSSGYWAWSMKWL